MANLYKRWLCDESLKALSSLPILIYFELRSKPSLIRVTRVSRMTGDCHLIGPYSPTAKNSLQQNIVFSYSEMIPVFFLSFLVCFFIFRFYVMLCYFFCYYKFLQKLFSIYCSFYYLLLLLLLLFS